MLAPGYPVSTQGKAERIWRVGGIETDPDLQLMTGQIGWQSGAVSVGDRWSDDDKAYHPGPDGPHGDRALPFGFDGETRLLTVLRDSQIKATTIAGVLQKILQANEDELDPEDQTTAWAVEPVLDKVEFIAWLKSVDIVQKVQFVAKLPNPEPKDAFAELSERMKARRGTTFIEEMSSDRPSGLVGIQHDRDFRQAVAMGQHGFAELKGQGRRGERPSSYNQADNVATEAVGALPHDWATVRGLVKDLLRGKLRRFMEEGDG